MLQRTDAWQIEAIEKVVGELSESTRRQGVRSRTSRIQYEKESATVFRNQRSVQCGEACKRNSETIRRTYCQVQALSTVSQLRW